MSTVSCKHTCPAFSPSQQPCPCCCPHLCARPRSTSQAAKGRAQVVAVQLQLLQAWAGQRLQPDTLHQGLEAHSSNGADNARL